MKIISKELMGASSVPLILSLLDQKDSYGYEITEAVRKLSDNSPDWKEGSLYPALKNLENNGLVVSYWVMEPGKHKRKYYKNS
jgi:PadR family transcriptional regulator, regulatory protein PadR